MPHGFHSSFRDWAAEFTDAQRDVCKLALRYVNSDRLEAAHWCSDLFERRRKPIQQWSDYLSVQT